MPSSTTASFRCLICLAPCTSWGTHVLTDCIIVLAAVLVGFRACATQLAEEGYAVFWRSITSFQAGPTSASTCPWRLTADADVPLAVPEGAVFLTWSGLLWSTSPQPLPARLRAITTATFLNSAAAWLDLPAVPRWDDLMRIANTSGRLRA